ncbi:phage tail protein [Pseudoflavitalea sp. G-6-1-2]|uniref:phage tail protein n=1 Tax=Pseudoflavitalea sp. G-6-1-2 TaxID=2728841 RepID=UPI00146EA4EA|nr:tail fiber protein [Pseudoflavitalea sp. G-6-1-2]NML22098.1 phage tail protein [Pseudoflavitalea sp. G-6-1-2]
MDGVLAVITCFAANYAPKYFALCNGQILSIAQNQALFSLLGTTYGGNGTTTFALPDLRGRAPIGTGQGPGLSNINLGEVGGSTTTTLTINNLPQHAHLNGTVSVSYECDSTPASEPLPDGFYIAGFNNSFAANGVAGNFLQTPAYTGVIANAGNNQPVSIMPPYLAINYIICLSGIYPSRN